jgi:6-phosphofructokinase 2
VSCQTHHVRPTLKTRTTHQRFHAGGGGTNVARVIAELGGAPELLYLSGGETASLYDHCLASHPLELRRFAVADSTRMAFMVHEEQTGFEYRFVPDGPTVTEEELAPVFRYVAEFRGDYVVASGSLPNGAPPDTYSRMAESVAARGGRFVLDTSGEALTATLESAKVFLLKPSMSELEKYVGHKLDEVSARDAAASMVADGKVDNIAVSMGKHGAILANADGVISVATIRVHEKSAVGAGDSFVAAMVWRLMDGADMRDAFLFGVAAGSAAVMTAGTELCRREDVHRLYETKILHHGR